MNYIKEKDLIPNMWYLDDKGNKILYLGKATRTNGYFHLPECYIYLKEEQCSSLFKYFLKIPSAGLLIRAAQKGNCYCASMKPRKLVSEIELHCDKEPITGIVDSFAITFYFREVRK